MIQTTRPVHPFEAILPQLTVLLYRRSPRRDPDHREEWVAEAMALAFQIWCSAQRRNRAFTTYSLARYACFMVKSGRRLAGSYCADACSATRTKTTSLDQPTRILDEDRERVALLSQVLADTREDSPFEHARRNLDYPAILDMEHVGLKARRVFGFLAETHGAGSQKELARALKLSPGRISQIKRNLSECLWRHGYEPPACIRKSAAPMSKPSATAKYRLRRGTPRNKNGHVKTPGGSHPLPA